MTQYDATEQDVVLKVFAEMLWAVTKDGGKKRARGDKPEWWRDDSHEAAIFSHLNKWKHGEKVDKDSGVHPLVHLAWRALAIAYQETEGQIDPATNSAWCSACSAEMGPLDRGALGHYHEPITKKENVNG